MALENDFLPFAVGSSANVLSQSAYAALTSILQNGFQSGIANSQQLNKVWRQSSIIAAMIAQFIVDNSGQTAIDDGTTATLEANLLTAVRNAAKQSVVLTDTGSANAYAAANTPVLTALPTSSGFVQRVSIANANTGASTYAPDGLTAKPIYGLGLQPLQGGELIVKGIATMLYVVASTVNSGNGAWVLLECTGGALQIAPATQSQHAVQFGQVAGVVGTTRNAKMSVTAASASATWSADEVVLETALGGLRYCVGSASGTINLATTGAGGMDTGSAPVSGFVAIYGIYKPSTGTFNLLATNATSAVQPNIYGGANMPAGYTASALVGVWPTNGSGQFSPGAQRDRDFSIPAYTALSTATQAATYTALSIAGCVPQNGVRVRGMQLVQSSATTSCTGVIASDTAGSGGIPWGNAASTVYLEGYFDVAIETTQTIYRTAAIGTGTLTNIVYVTGYSI